MDENKLFQLVKHQLEKNFLELDDCEKKILMKALIETREIVIKRFGKIINNHYRQFNVFNSDQYASFLYTLSYTVSNKFKLKQLADKIFYLNKIMNSVNIYHEVKLPELFILEHPLGTVLGRAEYGERFIVYQNCTVGSSRDEIGNIYYPKIGNDVTMYTNSSIIGNSKIGNNCIIAANTQILNEVIPDNSVVFGSTPKLVIKKNNKKFKFFRED